MLGFALLMGVFIWVIVSQPLAWWSRVNSSGTDFLRHLGYIRSVRADGLLIPGQAGYPKAFHALAAWLTEALGVPDVVDATWRAVAPVGFLMLGLILLGIMATASHAACRFSHRPVLGASAAMVGALAFVQTAWFSSFLDFGNVMNMVVGVALISMLVTGLQPGIFGSTAGSLVCGGALVVISNAWQLLIPVAGIAAIPWIVQFLRDGWRRAGDWAIWILSGALSVNGVLALGYVGHSVGVSSVTVSNLFRPDWWWWVAIAFAGVTIGLAFRRGLRLWGLTSLGMLAGGVCLVAFLMRMGGSTWDLMLYYPVKALWTAIVVVIPLASVGVLMSVWFVWQRASRRSALPRTFIRGITALTIGLVLAGVLGRGFAFPPHLLTIAQGRAGMPNWSLALATSMKDVPVPEEAEQGAIVFGLVPAAGVAGVTDGYVGMVDYMAMEALGFVGIEGAFDAPVKVGLNRRDMTQVCRYLKDHPNSLRITGPNPAAGAPWIIDSGCPASIVQPERWISLNIDPVWFERSPWEDGQWSFPTFAEVQQASLQW
jgi:hypothetical protein